MGLSAWKPDFVVNKQRPITFDPIAGYTLFKTNPLSLRTTEFFKTSCLNYNCLYSISVSRYCLVIEFVKGLKYAAC